MTGKEPMTIAAKVVFCLALVGAGSILLGFIGLCIAVRLP